VSAPWTSPRTVLAVLAVLDGAKALAVAVKEVLDHPVIARSQPHKRRNVRDHLPEKMPGTLGHRMPAAYHPDSALQAQALLEELAKELAKELDKTHPGAAGSLQGDGPDPDSAPARPAAHPGPHVVLDQRQNGMPRARLSAPTATLKTSAQPDAHRTATKVHGTRDILVPGVSGH
jgi:hypothetical protein